MCILRSLCAKQKILTCLRTKLFQDDAEADVDDEGGKGKKGKGGSGQEFKVSDMDEWVDSEDALDSDDDDDGEKKKKKDSDDEDVGLNSFLTWLMGFVGVQF